MGWPAYELRRRYLIFALFENHEFPSPPLVPFFSLLPLSFSAVTCHGDVSSFRKKVAVIIGAPITPIAAKMKGLMVSTLMRCDPLNSGMMWEMLHLPPNERHLAS